MQTKINPLQLRAVMGRDVWSPPHPFGSAGWRMYRLDESSTIPVASIIVSQAPVPPAAPDETRSWLRYDASEWIHASMTEHDRVPSYDELMLLKRAVWGDAGEAYQIHPSADRHVNIHPHALHLWGRADGKPALPDFGQFGTI